MNGSRPSVDIFVCTRDGNRPAKLIDSLYANCGDNGRHILDGVTVHASQEAKSIAVGFNRLGQASGADLFIFTHDDVQILSSYHQLQQAMCLALGDTTGVVGVAGARILHNTGCWWWDGKSSVMDPAQVSGACLHTDGKTVWMSAYGAFGDVVVLDGVLLMVRRSVFEKLRGFDKRYPGFDFYDVDFTLRAKLNGYRNYTYPLQIVHASVGDVSGKPQWHENKDRFLHKYGPILPVDLSFTHGVPDRLLHPGD